ncbi:MltR family transcriptional regulator [Bacillus thuringiensis]|uniref:MltR family transcriptional regulator n=1 Tax=Bacillus thuringiensis TaxID=1428 RepID=UPI000BEC38B1|nr:MltR family transcriptional regulator [Bacillus thuringiensis]PEC17922.1 transcriptional regulator [Bacillus thuringiensis]
MIDRLVPEFFKRFELNNQYMEALKEFEKELANTSDRGLVLVCGSIIDELLSDLLKAFLIKSDSVDKDLFKGNAALSNFDARINMAYYLGLLSKKEKLNITYLQRIRNKFAHQFVNISFESDAIINQCGNFEIPKNCYMPDITPPPNKEAGELPQVELNPIKKETSAKDRFIYTFRYLYYTFITRITYNDFERREEYTKVLTAENTVSMQIKVMEEVVEEHKNLVDKIQNELDKMKREQKDLDTPNSNIQDRIKTLEQTLETSRKDHEDFEGLFNFLLERFNYSYEVLKNSKKK